MWLWVKNGHPKNPGLVKGKIDPATCGPRWGGIFLIHSHVFFCNPQGLGENVGALMIAAMGNEEEAWKVAHCEISTSTGKGNPKHQEIPRARATSQAFSPSFPKYFEKGPQRKVLFLDSEAKMLLARNFDPVFWIQRPFLTDFLTRDPPTEQVKYMVPKQKATSQHQLRDTKISPFTGPSGRCQRVSTSLSTKA